MKLKDGSVLWFTGTISSNEESSQVPAFRYDVNGKKGPNTHGIDLFYFSITDRGIIPGYNTTYETPQNLAEQCENSTAGTNCAAYIIVHGNMNYLKE